MKATLDKKILAEALTAITRVVERRTTIPILSNVMLTPGHDSIGLTVSDLGLELRARIPAAAVSGTGITVPVALLSDIVCRLNDGAAVVVDATEKDRASIKSGRSRFVLPVLPCADFPELVATNYSHAFDLPAGQLAALMGRVGFAIGDEVTRQYLNGIYLHARDDKLRAVAINGHQLARLDTPLPDGAAGMPAIIVPTKTVREMLRLAQAAGKETVRLSVAANLIRLEAGSTVLTSKLIDATFPDYQRVIPAGNDKAMVAEAMEFAKAVARVATMVSERGKAIKLSLRDGSLLLSSRGSDGGLADEEIEVEYGSDPLEIGLGARYLAQIVETFSARLQMLFADAGSPVLFGDPDDVNYLVVLMPMRV